MDEDGGQALQRQQQLQQRRSPVAVAAQGGGFQGDGEDQEPILQEVEADKAMDGQEELFEASEEELEKLRNKILCGSGAWSVPLTPLMGVPAWLMGVTPWPATLGVGGQRIMGPRSDVDAEVGVEAGLRISTGRGT